MNHVTLRWRDNGGQFYPANKLADDLCEVFNTSYLSRAALDLLNYHFTVEIVA